MRLTRAQVATGLVVLGIALLAGSALGWLRAEVISVAGTTKTTLTGFQLMPIGPAAALALAAAGIALALTKKVGARIVCGIAAVAAGACTWAFGSMLFAAPEDLTQLYSSLSSGTGEVTTIQTLPTIWVGTLLSILGVALALAGLVLAARWPSSVSRYDITAVPTDSPMSPDPRVRAIDDWDALERGEDPTQ